MPDTIPLPTAANRPGSPSGSGSTPPMGPVEHLQTGCLGKHWFTPRADTVQSEQVATPDRDLAVLPSRLVLAVHRAAPEVGA
jgi:hypothetical protein